MIGALKIKTKQRGGEGWPLKACAPCETIISLNWKKMSIGKLTQSKPIRRDGQRPGLPNGFLSGLRGGWVSLPDGAPECIGIVLVSVLV